MEATFLLFNVEKVERTAWANMVDVPSFMTVIFPTHSRFKMDFEPCHQPINITPDQLIGLANFARRYRSAKVSFQSIVDSIPEPSTNLQVRNAFNLEIVFATAFLSGFWIVFNPAFLGFIVPFSIGYSRSFELSGDFLAIFPIVLTYVFVSLFTILFRSVADFLAVSLVILPIIFQVFLVVAHLFENKNGQKSKNFSDEMDFTEREPLDGFFG